MKKIIYFVVVLFLVFQFFGVADLALGGTQCSAEKGICKDVNGANLTVAVLCGAGFKFGSISAKDECTLEASDRRNDPNAIYTAACCISTAPAPTYTCLNNGGTCISAGDDCPANWQQKASDTCAVSGSKCCVQGTTVVTPVETGGNTIKFTNPLAFDTVEGLLSAVMTGFQAIVVLFAMIFFVWGAVGYIMSAGNEEKIKGAKSGMTASLIGMALGIAAPSLLKAVAMMLGWGDDKMCSSITDATAKANCQATFAAAPTTAKIALNVLEFLLGAVGILGIIMLIIGGIMYFGASADEKNVEAAKKTVKYAIIGIALALGSMAIMRQVAALLTAS